MSLFSSISKYENSKSNAICYENKNISYKTLIVNIRRLMMYFKNKGIKKGDVVTVVLPNIPLTIYTFYALNALGVIQNILHPLSTFENIIDSMEKTNSKSVVLLSLLYMDNMDYITNSNYDFYFVNPMYDNSLLKRYGFYIKYKKPKESNNIHLLDTFCKEKEELSLTLTNDYEPLIYLHSGGTSGVPKTIMLNNASIDNLANKMQKVVIDEFKYKSMLTVLPLFHGFGLAIGIHTPLYYGAKITLMMKFNAKQIINYINKGKVNYIIGVPLLYQKLMSYKSFSKSKLSNLNFVFVGGDNVSISLINDYNNLMKNNGSSCLMLEGYGLTETVTVCTVNTKEEYKIGSVGKPLDKIKIKILDDNLKELANEEVGEVFVAGDTLMNGYLNDIESSKNTLVNINDETYVRTGDLGYLDDEGYLFIKGRKKRMFKISGINVYPIEIEKIACEYNEVMDAALEYFDEPSSFLVLYILKNRNYNIDENELSKNILDSIEKRVMKYSLPKYIVYLDKFPKTRVGKIDHSGFINPCK